MKKLILILTVISFASCNNYQSDINMLKKSNDSLKQRCDTLERKLVEERIYTNDELIQLYEKLTDHVRYNH